MRSASSETGQSHSGTASASRPGYSVSMFWYSSAALRLVLDVPLEVDRALLGRIVRVRGQIFGVVRGDRAEIEGLHVDRSIGDVFGEVRLEVRLDDLGDGLLRQRPCWARAWGWRAVVVEQALVEGVGDVAAVLRHHVEAAVPAGDHVDFAVLHKLRVLRARRPPDGDVGLEFLDLLDRALDAARLRTAPRRPCPAARRRPSAPARAHRHALAIGALARKFLHVPEIGPALRSLVAVGLGVPGQHRREDVAAARSTRWRSRAGTTRRR